MIALAESGEHEPVNIGNPDEFTLLELAEAVIDVTGSGSQIVHHALPTDDPQVRRPDITRARQILDWEPATALRDGLSRTIDQAGTRQPGRRRAAVARAVLGALRHNPAGPCRTIRRPGCPAPAFRGLHDRQEDPARRPVGRRGARVPGADPGAGDLGLRRGAHRGRRAVLHLGQLPDADHASPSAPLAPPDPGVGQLPDAGNRNQRARRGPEDVSNGTTGARAQPTASGRRDAGPSGSLPFTGYAAIAAIAAGCALLLGGVAARARQPRLVDRAAGRSPAGPESASGAAPSRLP